MRRRGLLSPGGRAPWGSFDIRLCRTRGLRWEKAGRPPKDEWLSADAVPVAQRASDASLKARNQTLLDDNRRLREEVAGLREELAGAWGELRALQRRGQRTGPARTAS